MTTDTEVKAPPVENVNKCDSRKVQLGSTFSRHSHGIITEMDGQLWRCRNSTGFEWRVDAGVLEREFTFADQFETGEKKSRTELIDLVVNNPSTAMTVNYNKKVDAKVVADGLKAGQGAMDAKAWVKHVSTLLEGEERTMIGYHTARFDEHRRLLFNETNQNGPRLIDPRTFNWAIINRVKFVVKDK